VELVEEVQRGEAPVGAVEPDVLHQQRVERIPLRREERALEAWEKSRRRGREGEMDGCITFSAATM